MIFNRVFVRKCAATGAGLWSKCFTSLSPNLCLVQNRCKYSMKAKVSVTSRHKSQLSSPEGYDNYDNEKLVSKTLKNWFNLEKPDINYIFKEFPQMKSIDVKELEDKITLLNLKELCLKEVALKRSWTLTIDKNSLTSGLKLLEREGLLKGMTEENTLLFVMFIFDKRIHRTICKRIKFFEPNLFSDFDERLELFRSNLEINSELFCAIVKTNIQILTKDMNHIKSVMHLLKDYVSREDLINDHWIFIHNIDLMKRRIEESEGLLQPLKPWSLRCPQHIWDQMIYNLKKDAQVLGSDDIVSFMSKKLQCSQDLIEEMMSRSPRTSSIRPAKLDQVVTLLLNAGYSCADILRCPRVLNYSPKRIEERLNLCDKTEKPKLSLFLMTDKEFKVLKK